MFNLEIPYDCILTEAVLLPSGTFNERRLHGKVVLDKRDRFNSGELITTTPVLDTFRFEGGTLVSTKNSVYVVLGESLS